MNQGDFVTLLDPSQTMLIGAGLQVENHYGVRCLHDYWGDEAAHRDPETAESIEKLELSLTNRYPCKLLARNFQIIAHRPLPTS